MSRKRRNDAPGRVFHITGRVNWRAWHLSDDGPKLILAGILAESAACFSIAILAFVFMDNHFHLVLQSPIAEVFRQLTGRRTSCRHLRPWPSGHQNSTVVGQFMRKVRRTMSMKRQHDLGLSGRFWEGEYRSGIVADPLSLIARIAYDHRNPVKEGMVKRAEEYRWSSARSWATGEEGVIPLSLDRLPFDLEFESIRREILRFQSSSALDDSREELDRALASGDPKKLEELLRDAGLLPSPVASRLQLG